MERTTLLFFIKLSDCCSICFAKQTFLQIQSTNTIKRFLQIQSTNTIKRFLQIQSTNTIKSLLQIQSTNTIKRFTPKQTYIWQPCY